MLEPAEGARPGVTRGVFALVREPCRGVCRQQRGVLGRFSCSSRAQRCQLPEPGPSGAVGFCRGFPPSSSPGSGWDTAFVLTAPAGGQRSAAQLAPGGQGSGGNSFPAETGSAQLCGALDRSLGQSQTRGKFTEAESGLGWREP